jgi:hypothetical protein
MKRKCEKCDTLIEFKRMESGALMPVDATPQAFVVKGERGFKVVNMYVPHWATCSTPDAFRQVRDA